MSEKEPQIINQAFSVARQEHRDSIADAKSAQTHKVLHTEHEGEQAKKRSYAYDGGNYSETYYHEGDRYVDGKDTEVTETASGNDAALQRQMSRSYGYEGYESTDKLLQAEVSIPTTEGSAVYSAETNTHDAKNGSSTDKSGVRIIRKDAAGNEVYKFTSKNPELAGKIGALAAKRIIESVDYNQLDKVA